VANPAATVKGNPRASIRSGSRPALRSHRAEISKIRLLTRLAFGFRSPEALIALAMLALGGHRPALPGRA
jgi:hypothetical protein